MRILLGLCVLLLLGACNRVYTDQPLFFASDAPDAPQLRDGLWLIESEDKCRVDTRKPVSRWPKCAQWMLVRGSEILGFDPAEDGPGEWNSLPFVLADGDPVVLQMTMTAEGKTNYQYLGVDAVRSEGGSRIVSFRAWPVLCGPPPPRPAKGEEERYVTLEPLPGVTIVDNNCTAGTQDVVRAAARASRAWGDGTDSARWIRDTYP